MEPAITTLLTAIVTGGVALIGVHLTNKANSGRLELQLKNEEGNRNKIFMRERAEELYELTDEWLKDLFVNYLNLSFVMQGKFDYNQYLHQLIEHGEKSKSNFTRLEMLLSIYYPELSEDYKRVTIARSEINEIAEKYKHAYQNGDRNGEQYLGPFTKAQVKLEKYGDDLKEKIALSARNA